MAYRSDTIYAAKEFAKNEYLNRVAMYNSNGSVRAIQRRYDVITNICMRVDETNECYTMKCEDMSHEETRKRRITYLGKIKCALSKVISVDDMVFVIMSFVS